MVSISSSTHNSNQQNPPLAVSVVLPVIDETTSLRETVRILLTENHASLFEILIVVCSKTTPAAMEVCREISMAHPQLVTVCEQSLPFLGGAMRDAFAIAKGSHVLMMASDLETDPHTVKALIEKASLGYDVVTATRWAGQGGFKGYNPLKYLLNWSFQHCFRLLYGTSLSDLTYGFRIFKTDLVKQIAWEELRHPFLLETILKPLRLGAQTIEVPTKWRTRQEGVSHNPFWQNFVYLRIAFRTRFRSRRELLVGGQA